MVALCVGAATDKGFAVVPVGARGDPVHQNNILGVASGAAGTHDSVVA